MATDLFWDSLIADIIINIFSAVAKAHQND